MHLIGRRGSWLAAIAAVVAFALPGTAAAQTVTGTIQGTVVDTNGNVLPGVTVLVKHVETGAERTLVMRAVSTARRTSPSAATPSPRRSRGLAP